MAGHSSVDPLRGFKVTEVTRKRIVGIGCSNLNQLKIKGCKKLQIMTDTQKVDVCLSDGTIVDDEEYFKSIPSQTILILRLPGQNITEGAEIIYRALKSFNIDLLRAHSQVKQFLDEDAQNKIMILSQILKHQDENEKAVFSRKIDDPEWFEDLDTGADTKEEFMRKRSRGRIQRYLYTTKDTIKNSFIYTQNAVAKNFLDVSFNEFYERLKKDSFFSFYFDRTEVPNSLCDKNGLFLCQGLWNCESCAYVSGESLDNHRINPYVSKESRVIFSMWNLDHRVERSRRIIPALLHASEICANNKKSYKINSDYFYDLLFTMKNLKLVHIVCHDKNEHKTAVCDRKLFVIKELSPLEIPTNKRTRKFRNSYGRKPILKKIRVRTS